MYIHRIDKKQRWDAWAMGKKGGKKDSQLVLRLDKEQRDEFVALCKTLDTSAAREIRAFIRTFVKQHGGEAGSGKKK